MAVKNPVFNLIPALFQPFDDSFHVPSFVTGKKARDIFDNNVGDIPSFFNNSENLKEQSTFVSFQAFTIASNADVLAWESCSEDVDPKYYLSPKACTGILRRARKSKRPIPETLEKALETVAQE